MTQYFTDGYMVTRYVEDSGVWTDGEGAWVDHKSVSGYMRVLDRAEQTALIDVVTSHRFYTQDGGIEHGDKITKDNQSYSVKQVNHKQIPTSKLDFYQVECELVE